MLQGDSTIMHLNYYLLFFHTLLFQVKIPKTPQKERKHSAFLHILKTNKKYNHMINLIKQEKQTPDNTIGKDSTVSQCLDVSSTVDEEYFKTVS